MCSGGRKGGYSCSGEFYGIFCPTAQSTGGGRNASSLLDSSWEPAAAVPAGGCHLPRGITFGNSLSSPRFASNTLQRILHPQTRSGVGLCQHGALQGGAGTTRERKALPVWGRQGWEAAPSRAVRSAVPSPGELRAPGFVYVWPRLERRSAVAKYSSDAVIRVQPGWGIYFLQRLGGERAKTGVEMPEWCDSLSAVSGLTQGERAPCPECRPCDGSGEEEECVERLKLSLSAPRGRGGHLKSGSSACVASCLLPGKRFLPPQTLPCWVTGLVSQGINSQPPQIQKEQGEKHLKVQHLAVDVWERAAACPTRGGIGRAPPSLGAAASALGIPCCFHHRGMSMIRAPLVTHPEKKQEKRKVP